MKTRYDVSIESYIIALNIRDYKIDINYARANRSFPDHFPIGFTNPISDRNIFPISDRIRDSYLR